MKKIIDKIAGWLISLNETKDTINHNYATFMKRGKNGVIFGLILFGTFFTYFSFELYRSYGIVWLASIPVVIFVIFVLVVLVIDSYKNKLRYQNRIPRLKLVGINMDFNERILKKIYGFLTKYEFLDEDLTSFTDFYNVLVLDFDEHESALYFTCTLSQLKYILEKFKQYKQGLLVKTFENSGKVYHKGNLISSRTLSKKYSDFPPGKEFEKLIDSFFDFLGDN